MAQTTVTVAAAYALRLLSTQVLSFDEGITIPAASSVVQAGAIPIRGAFTRVAQGIAGGSLVLPRILAEDASPPIVVVANEGSNSINVFPALGEKSAGVANQVLAVPAGQIAVFIRVPNSLPPNDLRAGPDWRCAVIT